MVRKVIFFSAITREWCQRLKRVRPMSLWLCICSVHFGLSMLSTILLKSNTSLAHAMWQWTNYLVIICNNFSSPNHRQTFQILYHWSCSKLCQWQDWTGLQQGSLKLSNIITSKVLPLQYKSHILLVKTLHTILQWSRLSNHTYQRGYFINVCQLLWPTRPLPRIY